MYPYIPIYVLVIWATFITVLIPAPHHYTYFEQFDWLEKKSFTLR